MNIIYFISVFIIATCGLIYELVAAALASYLLGDSVTQFSTIIGVYLSAMGVGSYLSKYVNKNIIYTFVKVEILIGLIGGFSAAIMFLLFDHISSFRLLLYSLIFLIGMLVGLEIPLVMKILKDRIEFNQLVSKVFSFDYIGALLASIAFPLLLVPHLGLVKTSLLFGLLNVGVAIWTLILFKSETTKNSQLLSFGLFAFLLLFVGFVLGDQITDFAENSAYDSQVIYTHKTNYQKIVLTRNQHELKLYLNGNLQFSSKDEYRYHESLVHTGLASMKQPKHVLILGGGDGLAAREALKYPAVESILLVDLDEKMTEIFKTNQVLVDLNQNALNNKKLSVVNMDAFEWVKKNDQKFDFIIIDFPDPSSFSLGKLYTQKFYSLLRKNVEPNGFIVVQSTSPYVARKSFWCINETLASAGFTTYPYHTYVPSFGEWGFVLASISDVKYETPLVFPEGLKYLNPENTLSSFQFANDISRVPVEVNKLNNQALVKYFEDEWSIYAN
jgi:spermidine synthase